MNIKYLILISCLLNLSLSAQNIAGIFAPDAKDIYPGANIETVELRNGDLQIVNPITPQWCKAEIYTNNDNVNSNFWLKYDSYTNNLFLKKEDEIVTISPNYIQGFNLFTPDGDRIFRKFEVELFDNKFVEILVDDSVMLIKRFESKFLKSNYNKMLDAGNYNDKIITKDLYCLWIDSSKIIELPNSKKGIMDTLEKINPDVINFIDEARLKCKKEKDLITIVKFLNK